MLKTETRYDEHVYHQPKDSPPEPTPETVAGWRAATAHRDQDFTVKAFSLQEPVWVDTPDAPDSEGYWVLTSKSELEWEEPEPEEGGGADA